MPQQEPLGAPATILEEIIDQLSIIDGQGFYHAGQYYPNLFDCEYLRKRMAQKLARLDAAERARRIEIYRVWCEGKNDYCKWCGMRFASIRDCVLVDGALFHGFFCAQRWQEISAARVEITSDGEAARLRAGDAWEIETDALIEKRAMFREGVTGCQECGGSFPNLSAAVVEDSRLVHQGCRATVAR